MEAGRKIYDITRTLSDSLLLWPGDPAVNITHTTIEENDETITLSHLSFGAHSGTHVDAPAHFIPGGPLVETLDLDLLIGDVIVVDTGDSIAISAEVIEKCHLPSGTKRVLFRTTNSERWKIDENRFIEDYVGLTDEAAQFLITLGIRVIGTDYLSVAAIGNNESAHRILLDAGVILIESLNLNGIASGVYELICLPLKISGVEGAPARVVLLDRSCE